MSVRRLALGVLAALALASGPALGAQPSAQTNPPPGGCPCGMGSPGAQGGGMGYGRGMMHGMCGQMGQMANITVENTPGGAAVRFDAKDPSQRDSVRQMAQRMSQCMSAQTPPPPATSPNQ